MAKLPPLKRIVQEELTGMAAWFRPVIILLNSFCQNVWQALNNGLSLQDNLRCQIFETTYVGGTPLNITTSLTAPLVGILLLQVSGAGIVGAVQVIWSQIGPVITVSNITGLTAGNQYKLRLLLL